MKRHGEGYEVATSQGPWRCRKLVIASGACNLGFGPVAERRACPPRGQSYAHAIPAAPTSCRMAGS